MKFIGVATLYEDTCDVLPPVSKYAHYNIILDPTSPNCEAMLGFIVQLRSGIAGTVFYTPHDNVAYPVVLYSLRQLDVGYIPKKCAGFILNVKAYSPSQEEIELIKKAVKESGI